MHVTSIDSQIISEDVAFCGWRCETWNARSESKNRKWSNNSIRLGITNQPEVMQQK